MTIHSVASIRRARRFQDRRREKAAAVIATMARGASLNLTHTQKGSVFSLNGTVVAPKIALAVVNDVRVCSVNDGLFPATPQTWRYVKP